MAYSRRIAALAVLLVAGLLTAGYVAADEPPFGPQRGLLLLRNGNTLAGDITRAGDYYLVLLGPTSELRVPAKEVEAQVTSLDEAYELRQHGLFGRGAAPHRTWPSGACAKGCMPAAPSNWFPRCASSPRIPRSPTWSGG
jgi:hypothetical protein